MSTIETTLIVPCYNEADRLDEMSFRRFAEEHSTVELLFVDDGSRDATKSILSRICENVTNASLLVLEENSGKAEAIRQASLMLSRRKKPPMSVGFLDADLAAPPSECLRLVEQLRQNSHLKLVIGSRLQRLGGTIQRSARRHFLGRAFATLVSWRMNLNVYDSQCGCKAFSAETIETLFGERFQSTWLFDIELIVRTQRAYGESSVLEIPLRHWSEKAGSKLSLRDFASPPSSYCRSSTTTKSNNIKLPLADV